MRMKMIKIWKRQPGYHVDWCTGHHNLHIMLHAIIIHHCGNKIGKHDFLSKRTQVQQTGSWSATWNVDIFPLINVSKVKSTAHHCAPPSPLSLTGCGSSGWCQLPRVRLHQIRCNVLPWSHILCTCVMMGSATLSDLLPNWKACQSFLKRVDAVWFGLLLPN